MVDRRKRLHREIVATLPERQPASPPVEIHYRSEHETRCTPDRRVLVWSRITTSRRVASAYASPSARNTRRTVPR